MQCNWVKLIRPKLGAALKYGPPYVTDYKVELKDTILQGVLEMQIWPPVRSTESRLIIGPPPYKMMTIDCIHYDKFFYIHNLISRNWLTFNIPNDSTDVRFVPGYDRCYDCTNEMLTWRKFLLRKNRSHKYTSVSKLMKEVSVRFRQYLNMPNQKSYHGIFPSESRCVCRNRIMNLTTI